MSAIFGDDILCEILSGLPVKSLLQFKLVCKHWRSLIKDSHFIHLHLSRSKTRPFLLVVIPEENEIHYFSADLFEGGAAVHMITTPSRRISKVKHMTTFVEALKPINGLICFVRMSKEGGACIYNLNTREETPSIESTIIEEEERDVELYLKSRYNPWYGFGFDPTTKEHKVVCVWDIDRYTDSWRTELIRVDCVCEVFTVGQYTWRKINDIPPGKYLRGMNYIYVNGSIYWLNSLGRHHLFEGILAFDVGSEKFRVIPIPDFILADPVYTSWWGLMEVDGHLTLLVADCGSALNTFKLWMFVNQKSTTTTIINNHWVEETITTSFDWQREVHISFEAIPGTDLIIIKPSLQINKCILSLYHYDRKNKTSRKVEITAPVPFPMNHYDILSIFVESLLPVQNRYLRKDNVEHVLEWENQSRNLNQHMRKSNVERVLEREHQSRNLNQHLHKSSVEREQEREHQRRNLPPKPRFWFPRCAQSCFRSPPEN